MKSYKTLFSKTIVGIVAVITVACTGNQFEQLPSLPDVRLFSQSFDQETQERMVDLLVVVDNSRSMRADQQKLAREFSNFVSGISESDYRIGVTTTDTDSVGFENTPGYWGNLDVISQTGKNYISKDDQNPEALFSNIINRQETTDCTLTQDPEVCASFNERPLYAIFMAIQKREAQNAGFFRDGADLAVLIITDEDETEEEATGDLYTSDDLLSFIETEFAGEKKVLGFSIAIQNGDEECFNEQAKDTVSGALAVSYGVRVGELGDLTGGFQVSICNQNFGQDLASISDYVQRELLPFKHKLPESVDLNTIEVLVTLLDGREFEVNIEILGQELRITPTPPAGSKIEIKYEY